MKIIEYAIRLKDQASPALSNFGRRIATENNSIRGYANKIKELNKFYGLSYSELQQKIKETENVIRNSVLKSEIRQARSELAKLQRQAAKHEGNLGSKGGIDGGKGKFGVGTIVKGGLIAQGITSALSGMGSLVSESIQASFERQKIQTSFNVLTGSETKGATISKELIDLQQNTILGDEVFGNAQTMLSFGIASNEVTDSLKRLGDVSLGNKERLSSLALVYGQVSAAGKLQGQDLMQFINAGWNPLNEICKKTGESMSQVKDRMGKGAVSFAEVATALNAATSEGGQFNNMLSKIADTPAGKMAQLQGMWGEFKIHAGAALMPLVKLALDLSKQMLPIIESILPAIQSSIEWITDLLHSAKPYMVEMVAPALAFWEQLKGSASGLMDYVYIIAEVWQESIYPAIKKSFEGVMHILGGLIEWISKSGYIKFLFAGIMKIMGSICDIIGWVVDKIVWVWDNLLAPMLETMEEFVAWLGISKEITIKTTDAQGKKNEKSIRVGNSELSNAIKNNTAAQTQQIANENRKSADDSSKAITGGGTKQITYNISKFFDNIVLKQIGGIRESESEIEEVVLQCMSRVLANGANNLS